MTTEATRVAIEDMIDAFECGDHQRLADRYHEHIEWRFHASKEAFPFPSVRHGKDDVLAGLVEIYREYSVVHYKCRVLTVEGDRAATMADTKMIHRATGQVITAKVGGFHQFRDGKLIAYDGYADDYVAVESPSAPSASDRATM